MEKLLKEVGFLGVSLLHSWRSVSEVLEVALGVLDLRQSRMEVCLDFGVGVVPVKRKSLFAFCFVFEPAVSSD